MTGVEGAEHSVEWSGEVHLTWLSHCDVAVQLKELTKNGGESKCKASIFPLVPFSNS